MKGSLSCYRFLFLSILSRPVFPRLGHALLFDTRTDCGGGEEEEGEEGSFPPPGGGMGGGRQRSAHRVNVCSVLRASRSSSNDADHREIMDETWHGSKHGSILFLGGRREEKGANVEVRWRSEK